MNRYEELIQKYQTLNEFTLSQEDMDLYKSFRDKLESYLVSEEETRGYSSRFTDQKNVFGLKPFDDIIVIANIRGCICYANSSFYSYSCVDKAGIDSNPGTFYINNLRHPDMPKTIFKDLWETIRDGRMWSGVICNRNLRNQDYWQIVNIFPIIENGEITNYIAFNKRAPESIIAEIISFYRKIP